MRKRHWIVGWVATIACTLPAMAPAQPHVGVFMWRHDTEMQVDAAIDWDGSNAIGDERGKDWDFKSSGFGVRAGYMFPKILTINGDIGLAQATTRSIDVSDADLDVTSRGLDEGLYFSIGASATDRFPGAENAFWGASVVARRFSSEFDEDVATTWELDENALTLGGRIGYLLQGIGVYAGLRFVSDDTDLQITDLSRSPGLQSRSIDFSRHGGTDLIVGAEYRGMPLTGMVELGFIGSFGASTGLAMSY